MFTERPYSLSFISWGVNPPKCDIFLIIKNKINRIIMIISNIYLLKVGSSNPVFPTKINKLLYSRVCLF